MLNWHYINLLKAFIIFSTLCIFRSYALQKHELFPEIPDGDTMIVISADEYKDAVEPLVEWKNRRGLVTSLFVYPSETGGADATHLKEFIQGKYDSIHVTYVLLVGDYEDVPSLKNGGAISDPSFAYLSGNDDTFNICIGRFSVETFEQTEVIVQKVLRYEMTPDIDGNWYQKATGVASAEGSPTDKEWMDRCRDTLLAYGFREVDQIYDPDAKKEDFIAALNEGRLWVNYMGHGSPGTFGTTMFSITDINSLENNNMLPVILSLGVRNGEFENDTCLAEAFVRYGTTQYGEGAIAFLGLSNSILFPQFEGIQLIVDNLVKKKYLYLGNIIVNALNLWSVSNSLTKKAWTLFGDPSLIIITQKPEQLMVNHPTVVNKGINTITVHSEDSVKLCIYSKANSIHKIQNIPSGNTQVALEVSTYDTIHVTGVKMNHAPYIGYMIVDTSTGIKHSTGYVPQAGVCIRLNKSNKHYVVNAYISIPSVLSCDYTLYNLAGSMISKGKLIKSSDKSYSEIIHLHERTGIPAGVYLIAVKVQCIGKSPLYIYKRMSIL